MLMKIKGPPRNLEVIPMLMIMHSINTKEKNQKDNTGSSLGIVLLSETVSKKIG